MKFSTRSEYGLKALVNLAVNYPEHKNLNDISREEGLSYKYLERLFTILKKKKLVMSLKGKAGGYTLVKSPKEYTIGEIIEALEGSLAPMKCVTNECTHKTRCSVAPLWLKIDKQIRKTLYSITLKSIIK